MKRKLRTRRGRGSWVDKQTRESTIRILLQLVISKNMEMKICTMMRRMPMGLKESFRVLIRSNSR